MVEHQARTAHPQMSTGGGVWGTCLSTEQQLVVAVCVRQQQARAPAW